MSTKAYRKRVSAMTPPISLEELREAQWDLFRSLSPQAQAIAVALQALYEVSLRDCPLPPPASPICCDMAETLTSNPSARRNLVEAIRRLNQ